MSGRPLEPAVDEAPGAGAAPLPFGGEVGPRVRRIALVAILLVHALLVWLERPAAIGAAASDDARHVLLARALLEGSYRETYLLGTPVEARFPPGYPALVAATISLVGERYDALVAVNLALSLAALLLFFSIVRRAWSDAAALLLTGLVAVNPSMTSMAGLARSEPLYLVLTLLSLGAALRAADRSSHGAPSARHTAASFVTAGLAAFTRTPGITLLGALALLWLRRLTWKQALTLVGVAVVVLVWLVWTMLAGDAVGRRLYIADATIGDPGRGVVGLVLLLVYRVVTNAARYAVSVLPTELALPSIEGTPADNLLWIVVLVVAGAYGARWVWRRSRPTAAYLACYGALLLVWAWPVGRFLQPVLPLLLMVLLAGTARASARWMRRWAIVPPLALAALLAAGSFREHAEDITRRRRCDRAQPWSSEGCFNENYRAYIAAARHAADSLPRDAVVLAPKNAWYAYLTGHMTMFEGALYRHPPSRLAAALDSAGIGYVLQTPIGDRNALALRVLRAACSDFVLLRQFGDSTRMFAVRPAAGDGSACRSLARPERTRGR